VRSCADLQPFAGIVHETPFAQNPKPLDPLGGRIGPDTVTLTVVLAGGNMLVYRRLLPRRPATNGALPFNTE
jgi:hypothetical protein